MFYTHARGSEWQVPFHLRAAEEEKISRQEFDFRTFFGIFLANFFVSVWYTLKQLFTSTSMNNCIYKLTKNYAKKKSFGDLSWLLPLCP